MPFTRESLIKVQPDPKQVGKGLVFKTPSQSRPGLWHFTIKLDEGGWVCTCDGWQNHGHCFHVIKANEQDTQTTIKCVQCNKRWPEDPMHPGYPDVHMCTGPTVRDTKLES